MSAALLAITGLLYSSAWVLFLMLLTRGQARHGDLGIRALGAGVVAHVAYLAARTLGGVPLEVTGMYESLSLLALAMVITFLITARRFQVTVLGAFLAPITLIALLGASVAASSGPVPGAVRQALLPLHIGANVLGIAAFALASVAAVAYLIQERLLRAKKVMGMFQRLPPLDRLDFLGFRALLVGFALLSVGFITGAFWIVRGADGGITISPAQIFGALAWLIFAAVLVLRSVAGWRGRRAAVGTIVGFACTAIALAGYVLSQPGGPT